MKSVKDAVLVLKLIARFGQKAGEWPPLEMNLHFPAPAAPQHPSALTRAQQKKLQDYLRDHFTFRNLGILICLESGLRIGELCALQWRDLDVTGGVIHVTKTVQRIYLADGDERQYFLHFGPPKTTSSLRDVPMEGGLLKLIRPFARLMRPDYYVLSGSDVPVEPRTCRASYRKVLRELGLPPLRFHALRHSFATRCIESQCDYKTVSVILGHASISTTMDLYVHPGLDEKKRCIERMARALR